MGNSRFAQGNKRIYDDGTRLTGRIHSMDKSYTDVMKLGTGAFSEVTGRIYSDGTSLTKSISDAAQAYVDTLNYRTQNGTSRFVKSNEVVSLRALENA